MPRLSLQILPRLRRGRVLHVGQNSMQIYGLSGSVLDAIQHLLVKDLKNRLAKVRGIVLQLVAAESSSEEAERVLGWVERHWRFGDTGNEGVA